MFIDAIIQMITGTHSMIAVLIFDAREWKMALAECVGFLLMTSHDASRPKSEENLRSFSGVCLIFDISCVPKITDSRRG